MYEIVIAEDESLVSRWLETVLADMGHRVAGCVDASESAVKMAVKTKPDLVIMDNLLSGDYDGVHAAELIAKDADIPVLFMSSLSDADSMARMKAARPAGILFKPFRDAELRAAIDLIIQRSAEEHALHENMTFVQSIVDHIPLGLFVVNAWREIISWNGCAEMLFGYSSSDMIGKPADSIIAGVSKNIMNNHIDTLLHIREAGAVIDRVAIDGLTRDGSMVPLEMSLSTWVHKGSLLVNCVISGFSRVP